jgi:hypothetical protein
MKNPSSAYSGTPLAKKLGIRQGHRVKTRNAPTNYRELLQPLPEGVVISSRIRLRIDLWHLFTTSRKELAQWLPVALEQIPEDGTIWVSWPKKASRVLTDMTEDAVREAALPLGLVDVKVCAVDEIWSGLKLVVRKELRSGGRRA